MIRTELTRLISIVTYAKKAEVPLEIFVKIKNLDTDAEVRGWLISAGWFFIEFKNQESSTVSEQQKNFMMSDWVYTHVYMATAINKNKIIWDAAATIERTLDDQALCRDIIARVYDRQTHRQQGMPNHLTNVAMSDLQKLAMTLHTTAFSHPYPIFPQWGIAPKPEPFIYTTSIPLAPKPKIMFFERT